jgi:hypothetical protein
MIATKLKWDIGGIGNLNQTTMFQNVQIHHAFEVMALAMATLRAPLVLWNIHWNIHSHQLTYEAGPAAGIPTVGLDFPPDQILDHSSLPRTGTYHLA